MNEGNIFGYFPFTPISNDFINKYMLEAKPIFVIIYIYILNKYMNREIINILEMSNKMDILETDILKSLNYWKEKELIEFEIKDNILNIQFINKLEKVTNKVIVKKEKVFTENEISHISKQEEIQQLFQIIENKFAKTLSYQQRSKIIEIYTSFEFDMDVFIMLLTYCKEKNKFNFNYIEKVAIDWIENDIDTPQKVDNYVKFYDENYKVIIKALSLTSYPTPAQMDFMKKWVLDFKMPIELIKEACNITSIQIGNININYVDRIIEDWNKKGIRTMQQVLEDKEEFKLNKEITKEEQKNKEQTEKKQKSYQNTQRKNKFINFDEPDYDFDKLRELEIKYLKGGI